MMKRTLLSISAAALMTAAYSQSDGRTFDAAVVLVPGMTVERNGVVYGGDYTSGLLQHGDILRTDNMQGDPFYILTSDGSVLSISPFAEISIAGDLRGYDVFQVSRGSANVAGNASTNFTLPNYYDRYVSMVSRNVATAIANSAPAYVPGYSNYVSAPYANVYKSPYYGAYNYNSPYYYNPYGAAAGWMGNFQMVPWNSSIVISPWTIANGNYIR